MHRMRLMLGTGLAVVALGLAACDTEGEEIEPTFPGTSTETPIAGTPTEVPATETPIPGAEATPDATGSGDTNGADGEADAGVGGATTPWVGFFQPMHGDQVTSPVRLEMMGDGVGLAPAGEVIEGGGYFVVIIDGDVPPAGQPVPADEQHIHLDGGETEAELDLEPGEYDLTLVFVDGDGVPYEPAMTDSITVTVVEE